MCIIEWTSLHKNDPKAKIPSPNLKNNFSFQISQHIIMQMPWNFHHITVWNYSNEFKSIFFKIIAIYIWPLRPQTTTPFQPLTIWRQSGHL